jgi:type IV secretion system protein VirB10
MSNQTIISPDSHSPKGKVPRNLMVGGLLAFSVIGMAWYMLATPERKRVDAKEQVKAKITAAAEVQAKGSPASVDEAAQRATTAAHPRDVQRSQLAEHVASATNGLPFAPPAQAGTPSQGQVPPIAVVRDAAPRAAVRAPSPAMDPGEAERERGSRESNSIVFDRSGAGGSQPDAQPGDAQVTDPQASDAGKTAQDAAARPVPGSGPTGQPAVVDVVSTQLSAGNSETRQTSQVKWLDSLATRAGTTREVLRPVVPPGQYLVRTGKVIPAVLTREITSDAEGVITARSTENVYDSAGHLMIPKGSEFVGRYNSNVAFGQSRMSAAFTILRLPNGDSFTLPSAEISDALGRGGIAGDVDRHFVQSFGAALLMGVLADRVSQADKVPATQIGTTSSGLTATGQVFVNTANVELERARSIAPTITVPAGSRINVEVVRDMQLPAPYQVWSRQ